MQIHILKRDVQSSSSQLPKLTLSFFDENPFEWTEWSNLFVVVVHNRAIPNTERIGNSKTLLTGKAKSKWAIARVGDSRELNGEAWALLEGKFR